MMRVHNSSFHIIWEAWNMPLPIEEVLLIFDYTPLRRFGIDSMIGLDPS